MSPPVQITLMKRSARTRCEDEDADGNAAEKPFVVAREVLGTGYFA